MNRQIYYDKNFRPVKVTTKEGTQYYGLEAVKEGIVYYGKAYKVKSEDLKRIDVIIGNNAYVNAIIKNHILIGQILDLQKKHLSESNKTLSTSKRVNRRLNEIKLILKELKKNGFENFVHMTHSDNLIEIIKCGYLKSRSSSNNQRAYDNKNENSITNSVMSTNKSTKVEDYVRFYLRPKNHALFSMYMNNSKHVVLLFDESLVLENEAKLKPIFQIGNAHYLHDYEFNANTILSSTLLDKFLSSKDNYGRIFTSLIDTEHKNADKNYMQSELLLSGDVPIKYISKIVFPVEIYKNEFITKLKKEKIDNIDDIISKCIVDINYFMN